MIYYIKPVRRQLFVTYEHKTISRIYLFLNQTKIFVVDVYTDELFLVINCFFSTTSKHTVYIESRTDEYYIIIIIIASISVDEYIVCASILSSQTRRTDAMMT